MSISRVSKETRPGPQAWARAAPCLWDLNDRLGAGLRSGSRVHHPERSPAFLQRPVCSLPRAWPGHTCLLVTTLNEKISGPLL